MSDSNTCFVISPIGEESSETRRRSDQILEHIISPAVEELGYETLRADQISEPGMITSQVIQHVVEDALVIADLTGKNPNVYYELAIRHAIRRPLIQIISSSETIPFDVAGTRTIHVNHTDLDSVDSAKKEIKSQAKSVDSENYQIETPISVSLDLQRLRQSEKPEERSLADILDTLSNIRGEIKELDEKISDVRFTLPDKYRAEYHHLLGSPERAIEKIESLENSIMEYFVHMTKPATKEELERWVEGAKNKYDNLNILDEVYTDDMDGYRYADRDFILPELHGAKSVTVIVEEGVKVFRSGGIGHSTLLFMDGFRKDG